MNLEKSTRDEVVIAWHEDFDPPRSEDGRRLMTIHRIKQRTFADFVLRVDGRTDGDPPYYYLFIKNRAGGGAKEVMTYSTFFQNLIQMCPSIYVEDYFLGVRLVIGNVADLLVFKMLSTPIVP